MRAQKRPKWLKPFEMDMTEDNFKYDRAMIGGLIAFSLIIVQAFIATGLTDTTSYISVIAFAIAIPLLAMYVFTYSALDWFALFKAPARVSITFLGGCLIDLRGCVKRPQELFCAKRLTISRIMARKIQASSLLGSTS